MSNATLPDPYRVKEGDTLSNIAKRSGETLTNLMKYNGIKNANRLDVGQTLYLSKRSAFGVSAVFLDALRHPIENLMYQLHYDGQVVQGSTDATGTVPRQVTRSASSDVQIWVRNAEHQWQQISSTVSGYGHKLLTLVSGAIVIKGQIQLHPTGAPLVSGAPAKPASISKTAQPALPAPATGSPSKNNPNVKTKPTKGPQGQSVIQVAVDIPQGLLDYFSHYTGGDISDTQWKTAANVLSCEPEVLRAIAQVESGGRTAFWQLNNGNGAHIPAIMYERHYFSRLTNHQYDKTHPDISWPTGYRTKKQLGHSDKKMPDGKVGASDIYSSYASSYLRLINAFHLNEEAALKSCSWGKFQVMGENHELCGARNIKQFIQAMCTSELDQIQLLAQFIQRKPQAWKSRKNHKLGKEMSLREAVKAKNWQAIAFNYNGPGYKTYSYDTKLKAAYEALKS